MQAKLPKFLKPTSNGSFVRLGKNNDGGYIIDKNMNDARVYMASGLSSLGMFWFLERLF